MNKEAEQIDAFDIGTFDTKTAAEAGQEFEVMHPHTGGTGFFIRMRGTHSEKAKTELRRIMNRSKAARGGAARNDDEEEGARFLASLTVSWRSEDKKGKPRPVTIGGKELPFSQENALKVYLDYPLIAEQAQEFALAPENFIRG